MKYYKDLDERLQRYKGNTSTVYLDELGKRNIVVDSNEVKDFMFNSVEDFKEILNSICKYSLSEDELISILKVTNIELTKKIDDYLKKGMLSLAFIKENLEIFDVNNNMINIIDNNINILNNYGINPQLFFNYPNVLMDESNILSKNIQILIDYKLKGSLRTVDDYQFILDNNLASKIDKFIELGFSDYLEEDLGLINSNNIKRLEVLKLMNIPIDNIDDLRKVLNNQRFIINDDDLDEYISNALSYKKKVVLNCSLDDLEKCRINQRTYAIGGVLVSSNKVNRLVSSGHDMYDAITSDLILTEDEYNDMFGKMKQFIKE